MGVDDLHRPRAAQRVRRSRGDSLFPVLTFVGVGSMPAYIATIIVFYALGSTTRGPTGPLAAVHMTQELAERCPPVPVLGSLGMTRTEPVRRDSLGTPSSRQSLTIPGHTLYGEAPSAPVRGRRIL